MLPDIEAIRSSFKKVLSHPTQFMRFHLSVAIAGQEDEKFDPNHGLDRPGDNAKS